MIYLPSQTRLLERVLLQLQHKSISYLQSNSVTSTKATTPLQDILTIEINEPGENQMLTFYSADELIYLKIKIDSIPFYIVNSYPLRKTTLAAYGFAATTYPIQVLSDYYINICLPFSWKQQLQLFVYDANVAGSKSSITSITYKRTVI